ncbi:CPBP family intramembrane glutamic endopeptidase [Xanthovirga aplysinae]|uniref:CPBP family intramembrane glutamic endopeptidase n=1 Tax=Xanthovirga aplysinae TaxID=2529853 RepID=UPI0012BB5D9F|nr:CPBP family intramembrane glutamic endopeptidase [Xanthovirga aplysinae]MTI32832.1 CPBP family intramembrane metalloprotease [Xanthovirga aplysinae]
MYPFALAIIFALWSETISTLGLLFILFFGLFAFVYPQDKYMLIYRIPCGIMALIMSYLLANHLLPGFNNMKVLDQVYISRDGIPFTMYLNFDKTLITILILGFGHQLIHKGKSWKVLLKQSIPLMLPIFVIVLTFSYLLSLVHFDPKLPESFFIWALVNLFFVCTAEEAFFRGFIQKYLKKWLISYPFGRWWAILITSLLFGFAYHTGGIKYMALATLTGFGYGWLYDQTQRIESSILTHFLLNTFHFLFFTYPALAEAY